MAKDSNILDFQEITKKRKQVATGGTEPTNSTNTASATKADKKTPVLDMTERRAAIIQEERRKVRRTILTEFIGAFVVLPDLGLQKVTLYDISEDGLGFDMPVDVGLLQEGEEVAMRVYLNQQTYFPFSATIQNSRFVSEEGVYRHGGEFVKGDINEDALQYFVKFIETVSASLKTDRGDVMVSKIGE